MNFRAAGIALQVAGGVLAAGGLGCMGSALIGITRGSFTTGLWLVFIAGLFLLIAGGAGIWLGRRVLEEHDPNPNLTAARWRRVQEGLPASSRARHKGQIRQ